MDLKTSLKLKLKFIKEILKTEVGMKMGIREEEIKMEREEEEEEKIMKEAIEKKEEEGEEDIDTEKIDNKEMRMISKRSLLMLIKKQEKNLRIKKNFNKEKLKKKKVIIFIIQDNIPENKHLGKANNCLILEINL